MLSLNRIVRHGISSGPMRGLTMVAATSKSRQHSSNQNSRKSSGPEPDFVQASNGTRTSTCPGSRLARSMLSLTAWLSPSRTGLGAS